MSVEMLHLTLRTGMESETTAKIFIRGHSQNQFFSLKVILSFGFFRVKRPFFASVKNCCKKRRHVLSLDITN